MKTTNNIKNMNNMKVTLLNYTPLWVCSQAIRTCWQSQGNSDTYFDKRGNPYWMIGSEDCDVVNSGIGPKDRELIDRIGNKFNHGIRFEDLYYYFNFVIFLCYLVF
jgi:thymidylate synthase (FAD)